MASNSLKLHCAVKMSNTVTSAIVNIQRNCFPCALLFLSNSLVCVSVSVSLCVCVSFWIFSNKCAHSSSIYCIVRVYLAMFTEIDIGPTCISCNEKWTTRKPIITIIIWRWWWWWRRSKRRTRTREQRVK